MKNKYWLIILVLLSALIVEGASINTKIIVNNDGSAEVLHIIDSLENEEKTISLPIIQPTSIEVYDNQGPLSNELLNDSILVTVREINPKYSFQIKYVSEGLTSKSDGRWIVRFPSIGNKPSGLILTLPTNSIIYDFTEGGFTFLDKYGLNIGWRFQNQSDVEAVYSYSTKNKLNTNLLIIGAIIAGLAIVSILLIMARIRKKKSAQSSWDSILATLDPRESEVFEYILKNKKCYQSQIQKETNLAKSTVSRVISRLKSKNLVKTRNAGCTNVILLNENMHIKNGGTRGDDLNE